LWAPRAVPWSALIGGILLATLAPGSTTEVASWPFLIALIIFGMPHGAADWSVAARLGGRTGFARRVAGFSWYLAMMVGCTVLLAWQPGIVTLFFLLLTVFHFGMADATAVGADDDGALARWSLVCGRGLLLLATAFAGNAVAAWAPFAEIAAATPWADAAWMPDLDALQAGAVLGVAAGAVLAVCGAIARIRRARPREAALDLAEHGLVTTMAALTDPLFAVGCFFLGVHAFRHTCRLANTRVVIEPPPAPAGAVARLVRVHALSMPLMAPTALCLWPLCLMLGGFGARHVAVASIAFYMISTLPHHLLGLRLPRPSRGFLLQ
jgi:Brp/Blh family beta-carotene 15,15'-monooxygenase